MNFNSFIFLISILSIALCKNYLPRFESLPPPLVYYADNGDDSPRILTCKAWPPEPLTEIKMYSTMRVASSDGNRHPSQQIQFMKSAPLHPLDSEYVRGSSIIISNVLQARTLSKFDLHCLAKTQFGAVISRPFRVVEASIGAFPSARNVGEAHKVVKYFMHGNVAFVECVPPVSHPPADIEFKLNDSVIHVSHRYKYIKLPNSQRVILLIQAFEPRDQGYYRCFATNSITGEVKTDPLIQQLKIKSPMSKMPVFVKMNIFGKELSETGSSAVSPGVISVREGSNVTLFCVMEGAPPPYVTTYKLLSSPSSQNRHISDKEFGLLTITKVTADDEDSYLCTENSVTVTGQLKVQRRLSITQGPQDIRVSDFGSPARFTCLSNEPKITPQWYFNGRIRTQTVHVGKDSSLHIAAVRKEDLGVYQCVARSHDEWVTQVASLSLKEDILVTKEEDAKNISSGESPSMIKSHGDLRGSRIKKNVKSLQVNTMSVELLREELASPTVYTIDDNLAVLLKWQPEDSSNGIIRHYKVQYISQKGGDTKHWSPIQTLDNEITEHYFYVTSRHLEAQYVYMFRISVVMLSSLSRHSQWSKQISFSHIYPAQPIIQQFQNFNATHMRVQWLYTAMSRFPVTSYKLLVRRTVQDGSRVQYLKYWGFLVTNPDATETYIGPLSAGSRYQVVVYGIRESEPRKITKYSAEATFETPLTETSSVSMWPIKSNSESNTRLMFVILGSLAGLMVLVIVVLVLMCYCRERKSMVVHRLNRYKDPAKVIHNNEPTKAVQSSFLLASISAAAANANKQQQQQENSAGEHTSLLSTGPDAAYYQQKRQPPSGGSGHDISDGEGVSVQEQASIGTAHEHRTTGGHPHHMYPASGLLTPQPPAVTYYKAAPGTASLPAGSLMRPGSNQQVFSAQRYSPGFQYAPQILYTNTGLVYSPGSYVGTMYPHQQQQQQHIPGVQKQDTCEMRSQDGGESVYSYFSQTSTSNPRRENGGGFQGTVETGSQTMNSTGSAGHRHHRRKRRKTNNSAVVNEIGEMGNTQQKVNGGDMRNMYIGGYGGGQREVMYDTPPTANHQQDPRLINVPPGMVLMQPGGSVVSPDQCWGQMNNTLTRRGTPTLFVEPPRIRDYSEYGIPHNQMMIGGQPQQLAHLSQQNLHLHNQHLSGGYRDAQA